MRCSRSATPGAGRSSPISRSLSSKLSRSAATPSPWSRRPEGIRKDLPQVRPELFVEEVDLVQHHDRGLLREPGRVKLGPQRALGPFRVFAGIEHERK